MKITNNFNLPEAILKALSNDPYSKGEADYSVTELLRPPRQLALQRMFDHLIEEDASDMIYRLYGQIIHGILHAANERDLSEKRFFAKFLGKTLSGQIDTLSESQVLTDFKFATAFKFKTNSPPDPDWTAQLNMQLQLLRRNGLNARKLQIVGLVRDFRPKESKDFLGHPKAPIVVVDIPIWPEELTVRYIETRIKLHEDAKHRLPECNKLERWAKDDIHAVMKGRRAITGGLKSSHLAALEMHKANPGSRIEFRPAVNTRCAGYCSAAAFCDQFNKLKGVTK